jgi:hypothetical protein
MDKPVGRSIRISPFRRMVVDLMHFSAKVPAVCIERRMNLAEVVAARRLREPHASWSAIFAKAFGMVGRDYPELRRSYMTFPWARLYEHPHNIATLNVYREHAGENTVLYAHIRGPENRSLEEIDAILRQHREAPLDEIGSYRRARNLGRVPWPLRRFIWWFTLNVMGKLRCHNFGTFGITSVAGQGASVIHLVPLLTSTLHYGLFDKEGNLDMRLSWDHRVYDGVVGARVLADLEDALNRVIAVELQGERRAVA